MKICNLIPEEANFGSKIFDISEKICKKYNLEYIDTESKADPDVLIIISPCILGADYSGITCVLPSYYNSDENIEFLEEAIEMAILEAMKPKKKLQYYDYKKFYPVLLGCAILLCIGCLYGKSYSPGRGVS
jgi:hypothetical protein